MNKKIVSDEQEVRIICAHRAELYSLIQRILWENNLHMTERQNLENLNKVLKDEVNSSSKDLLDAIKKIHNPKFKLVFSAYINYYIPRTDA